MEEGVEEWVEEGVEEGGSGERGSGSEDLKP